MKKGKMDFRDKIKNQVQTSKDNKRNYGYLQIPKGMEVYTVDIPKKLESIKVMFDIIPYIVKDAKHPDINQGARVGQPWWRRPVRVHKNIGVDNIAVICLTTFGKRCPICDYKKELATKKEDKEVIKALNYSYRSIYIVHPIDDDDYKSDYCIFDISDFCFYEPLMVDVEEENQYNFPSIDDGSILQVRFNKESFNNNTFSKAIRVKFLERDEQYEEDVLDEVPCLDEIFKVYSYEELQSKFFETEDEVEEVEEIEEETTRARKKNKRTKELDTTPKEEPELTWEDLEEMSQTKLERVIHKKELDIDPDDYDDDVSTLRKEIAKELDIESPKPKKPTTKPVTRRTTKPKKSDEENECPYDHEFGADCEKFDDCNDCDKWEECYDFGEGLKNKK